MVVAMSERTAALGTPVGTIEWEGQSYSFGVITEGIMGELEAALFESIKAPLVACKKDLDPEHYAKRMDALLDAQRRGDYSFESKEMMDYLETPRGAVKIIAILMGAHEDVVMAILQSDQRDKLNDAFSQSKILSLPPVKGDSKGKGSKHPKVSARKPG